VTRVKVCGITRPEDAELAASLGAWAVGFNFWEHSKRRCDPAVAAGIARALRRRVEPIGVFVNPTLDEVVRLAEGVGLTHVQLHGDEGPAFCTAVAERTGARVIKALRVASGADIRSASRFHTDFHLLDAYSPESPGGTGESFDWELARKHSSGPPVVLSGGLTAENVGTAIEVARPFAVDVASGTEAAPGRKDPAKLEAFMRAVEAADARLGAVA